MSNNDQSCLYIITDNIHLIAIALFGSLVLFCFKMAEHFMRAEQDKLPLKRYIPFTLGLLIALPFFGMGMTSVYLLNGDKLSPVLALQVGLTSPAIFQSFIIAAANRLAKSTKEPVNAEQ